MTAASNALPPRSSVAIPAADASQCVDATMPNVPRSSGRVVNRAPPVLRKLGLDVDELWPVTARLDEMAGDQVAAPVHLAERRLLLVRARRRLRLERAAGAEPAAGGRAHRARDLSLEQDPRPGALNLGVRDDGRA